MADPGGDLRTEPDGAAGGVLYRHRPRHHRGAQEQPRASATRTRVTHSCGWPRARRERPHHFAPAAYGLGKLALTPDPMESKRPMPATVSATLPVLVVGAT